MAQYLIQFSYNQEGLQGLIQEGGTRRREVTERLVRSLGGKLVAFYFAFGEYDGIAIIEDLENVDAAAVALAAASTGAVKTKTTVLMTPKEVDKAVQREGDYRPPGQS